MRALAVILLLDVLPSGCGRRERPDLEARIAESAAAAASARTAPSASAVPAGNAAAGTWTGTYDSTAHKIDLPTKSGGIPEWAADDGKVGVGPGKIEVRVAGDGSATGSASGALGAQAVRGAAEGEAFTLGLVPAEPGGFAGTLVARRDGPRFVGTLSAASGNGRTARGGAVTFTRAP